MKKIILTIGIIASMFTTNILTQAATSQTSDASVEVTAGTLSLELEKNASIKFETTFSSNKQSSGEQVMSGYPVIVKDFRGANTKSKLNLKFKTGETLPAGVSLELKPSSFQRVIDNKDNAASPLVTKKNITLTTSSQPFVLYNASGHIKSDFKYTFEVPAMTDVTKTTAKIVWELSSQV